MTTVFILSHNIGNLYDFVRKATIIKDKIMLEHTIEHGEQRAMIGEFTLSTEEFYEIEKKLKTDSKERYKEYYI